MIFIDRVKKFYTWLTQKLSKLGFTTLKRIPENKSLSFHNPHGVYFRHFQYRLPCILYSQVKYIPFIWRRSGLFGYIVTIHSRQNSLYSKQRYLSSLERSGSIGCIVKKIRNSVAPEQFCERNLCQWIISLSFFINMFIKTFAIGKSNYDSKIIAQLRNL